MRYVKPLSDARTKPAVISVVTEEAQTGCPARPQRVRSRVVPLRYGEGRNDARTTLAACFSLLLARIIHECRREVFETEARRGCSHVRPTQAYWQSVEEAEREQPRRATGSDAGAGIDEESGLVAR